MMGRSNNRTGIVHLGLGAFFRAHGAIYTQDAMARSGGDWGICGVSLRSPRIRDLLKPRAFAYTAVTLDGARLCAKEISVVKDVLVAPEDPSALLDRLAAPQTRIVSLTITEKGYCHIPATGRLNPAHPDIVSDLAGGLPVSAAGYIVRALQKRRAAGLPPFTVLSLDNLPNNGRVIATVVHDLAAQIDTGLAQWIAEHGAFPCTMVDRIVPATTDAAIAALEETTGIKDPGMVQHEAFRQWVIEDRFVEDAHPDWAGAGAQFVEDVAPFELMKLRMLNGAHSALAYAGQLLGHETVFDAIRDPVLSSFLDGFWHRAVIPSLTAPPGTDLAEYASALRRRFENPGIRHLTAQIASDGSHKLPQRILSPMTDNLRAGRPVDPFLIVLASWVRTFELADRTGQLSLINDPLAQDIKERLASGHTADAKIAALLTLDEVFAGFPMAEMADALADWLDRIARNGVAEAIEDLHS